LIAVSTQHSALSIQHSAFSTQHSALSSGIRKTGMFKPYSLKPFLQQVSELKAQANSHLLATL
jgi:hypothetical protein